MSKILLLGEITTELKSSLSDAGYESNTDTTSADHNCIIVRGGIPVTDELMAAQPQLKLIISAGIGVDNIDLVAAKKRNIIVANCPYASAISTAEHTIALLLSSIKKVAQADAQLKLGTWNRSSNITSQWYGKTLGIVGVGKVGGYVGKTAKALGFRVIGYDPYIHLQHFIANGIEQVLSLEELFSKTNYVSLNVSKTKDTENLITEEHLKLMNKNEPRGIVNTCRGGVISEKLVLQMLNSEKLDFYAADVFEIEPNANPEILSHAKVVATPHIAANTNEAQSIIARDVMTQLDNYFNEKKPPIYAL